MASCGAVEPPDHPQTIRCRLLPVSTCIAL